MSAFLLDYHDDPAEELYDIENDPFEKNNLATSHEQADKLAELRELVAKQMNYSQSRPVAQRPRQLLTEFSLPKPGR